MKWIYIDCKLNLRNAKIDTLAYSIDSYFTDTPWIVAYYENFNLRKHHAYITPKPIV